MVIADFNFKPAFARLAKKSPYSAKQIESYFWNSGLEPLYDGGKMTSFEFYRHVKTELQHGLSYGRFKALWNDIFTPKRPVIRLLGQLSKDYRLVLISNTNAMHYDYLREAYSVLSLFDQHILSFKEKIRKPDVRIYRRAIRACRAKPQQIFYIDDRKDQTSAAQSIGIEAFTFKNNPSALIRRMKSLKIL